MFLLQQRAWYKYRYLLGRQLGVTLLDGVSITPDRTGERDTSATMAPATPAFRLIRIETKDSIRSAERRPNPLLGDAFAMVTGGGTLPVMGSAVMGLPTLRLPTQPG